MIYYFVTRKHAYTIRSFINMWAEELQPRIKVLSYESLPYCSSMKQGTYIFSDIERLAPGQAEVLSSIWEKLENAGNGNRLLNHPTRSFRRFRLLRTLYEQGVNRFNIHRLSERRRPERFPVFIRRENDHTGSLTPLLETPAALDAAIKALLRQGGIEDKVMVEFCNTANPEGIFRKYSAYIVGDEIFPQHMMIGREWMLKSPLNLARKKADLYEERNYMRDNPHEERLRKVFKLAGINYGRVDYGMLGNQLQIWEINTNPTLMNITPGPPKCIKGRLPFVQKMISAFETLDDGESAPPAAPVAAAISGNGDKSGSGSFFASASSSALDRYYYLRQWTIPRKRRMAINTLRLVKAHLRKMKGYVK